MLTDGWASLFPWWDEGGEEEQLINDNKQTNRAFLYGVLVRLGMKACVTCIFYCQRPRGDVYSTYRTSPYTISRTVNSRFMNPCHEAYLICTLSIHNLTKYTYIM